MVNFRPIASCFNPGHETNNDHVRLWNYEVHHTWLKAGYSQVCVHQGGYIWATTLEHSPTG
jgi:hypothetical protein